MVLHDVVRITHQSFSPLVGNPSYKHNATAPKYIKHLKTVSQKASFSCFNCHESQKVELEHQALTLKMCAKHRLSYIFNKLKGVSSVLCHTTYLRA